ncbi:vanillate demethylase subunit B [Kushneria sinocarnis]|uniref:Vanillate demethylase subunit B n=1 Tax=Kushneria sinocarnis TaxID=595502 RepID=A0A420WWE8_9GAMM|nr:PDR/VanB family oxidoreductase [Kushneria sinocarnis]RKR03413.1 vanillate demethylase subunit B [Kushneria sinocarnis]
MTIPARRQRVWQTARVARSEIIAEDVRLLDLVPDGPISAYTPGSHVDVQVPFVHDDGQQDSDIRSYSLIEDAAGEGCYRIAVKRVAHSRGGSRFMWSLCQGDTLPLAPPSNFFSLSYTCPEYLLVAGGIGITALHGMALSLARAGKSFRLLYCARSRDRLALAESLRTQLGDRLETRISDEGSRLDTAAEIAQLHPEGELYMCGPMALMDHIRDEWRRQGRAEWRLRHETFANSGRLATVPFTVAVENLGVEFEVPVNRSMLDALREHDVEILADCERGECGLCAVEVVAAEGEIDHRDVFMTRDQQRRSQHLCACVSRANGRVVIDTTRQGTFE